jgi:hypothetical protein
MGRACNTYVGGEERANKDFPEGKRPLGRSRRRWNEFIEMELQEVG